MKASVATLAERVVATLSRYRMFPAGQRVGVAVSGGADSLCLLHVLCELRERWPVSLHVLHVDHGWRGEASDADAVFVAAQAERLALPFHLHHAAAATGNREQAAREARHAFFASLRDQGVVDWIATGHTRSDQAETVLFRLLRGAGPAGLAGILPVTAEHLVRPLLEVDRGDTEAFLRERGVVWREDATNQDVSFARNRLRHEWLPRLREAWNPHLDAALAHTARLAQDDEAYWHTEVERHLPALGIAEDGVFVLDVRRLMPYPRALRRRLLVRVMERVRGHRHQWEFAHLDGALALAEAGHGHGRLQVPGLDLFRSFHWLRVAQPHGDPGDRFWEFPVQVPGTIDVPGSRRQVALEYALQGEENQCGSADIYNGGEWQLDAEALDGDLRLQSWRPGDRFRQAGDTRDRLLKEWFQQEEIPLWERRSWPILTAGGRIAWVWQFGVADGFVAGSHSQRVLKVRQQAESARA